MTDWRFVNDAVKKCHYTSHLSMLVTHMSSSWYETRRRLYSRYLA